MASTSDLGHKEIDTAYTIAAIIHVVLAIGAVVGGIVLLANSHGVAVLIASGVMTLIFGPLTVLLIWIFVRLWFLLIHDVHAIKEQTIYPRESYRLPSPPAPQEKGSYISKPLFGQAEQSKASSYHATSSKPEKNVYQELRKYEQKPVTEASPIVLGDKFFLMEDYRKLDIFVAAGSIGTVTIVNQTEPELEFDGGERIRCKLSTLKRIGDKED